MIAAYAVRCRFADVGIIRNALKDIAEVRVVEPEALASADPHPDVVFFGWGDSQVSWANEDEQEQRIRNLTSTCILLRHIRTLLSFQDVPVLVVVERRNLEDSRFATQYGASGLLTAPLQEDTIRSAIADALRPVGQATSIDVRLVNPFVEATLHVLEQFAKVTAVRQDVLLKKDYWLFGEISAVLGITGKDLEGTVGITFQDDLACEIVSRMWNEPVQNLTAGDINDGLGELVNVISGQATTRLTKETELEFDLALPTIVTGFGHEIQHRSDTPCLVIVFEALSKRFAVQIAMRTGPTNRTARNRSGSN